MTWLTAMEYLCHKWPRYPYVPLVGNTSRSFPHSCLITEFVTRLTRRVSLVEQELPTLPEHLSSSPVLSGVRVPRSLVYVLQIVVCPFVLFLLAKMLCCLLFFDIRILIIPFVSSNSSWNSKSTNQLCVDPKGVIEVVRNRSSLTTTLTIWLSFLD